MINGPGNVWVERGGPSSSPSTRTGSHRRGALPGGDPHRQAARARSRREAHPRRAARRRLPGRHLHPARGPHVAMTIRRFGGRAFSPDDLVGQGDAARGGVPRRQEGAPRPAEHPGLRGHRLGEDHAAERADRAAPRGGADRRHRGHARAQDRPDQLPALRGRSRRLDSPVSIRDLVRHALRHRPDHIVVGEVRGGEAADLLQALNTGHGGSLISSI